MTAVNPSAREQKRREKLTAYVKLLASQQGFDDCRIVSPDAIPDAAGHLAEFVADGHHASMDWMAETMDRRANPKTLWPDVSSIIMLAMNYGPGEDPRGDLAYSSAGNISVYARNRDYHDVIKGRLKEIAGKLAARSGAEVKVFVDTAPVMEKPLAEAAGLGWQGKHTNLVSRTFGSWLFLGSIFTTEPLDFDEAETDHCGNCRACLDICPTNAFPSPYRLDAARCISYLTIEHKGPIAPEFRSAIGNRIYGCDDCLAACPWNKFASAAREIKLTARTDLKAPPLAMLLDLDDAGFRALFSGSPVKRIGRDRFIRNCLVAAGNSGDTGLAVHGIRLLGDPSPLVAGMAVWMLARLLDKAALQALKRQHSHDNDPLVLAEWELAGVCE